MLKVSPFKICKGTCSKRTFPPFPEILLLSMTSYGRASVSCVSYPLPTSCPPWASWLCVFVCGQTESHDTMQAQLSNSLNTGLVASPVTKTKHSSLWAAMKNIKATPQKNQRWSNNSMSLHIWIWWKLFVWQISDFKGKILHNSIFSCLGFCLVVYCISLYCHAPHCKPRL